MRVRPIQRQYTIYLSTQSITHNLGSGDWYRNCSILRVNNSIGLSILLQCSHITILLLACCAMDASTCHYSGEATVYRARGNIDHARNHWGSGVRTSPKYGRTPNVLHSFLIIECDYVTDCTKLDRPV